MAPLVIEKDYGQLLIESALHSYGPVVKWEIIPPDFKEHTHMTENIAPCTNVI